MSRLAEIITELMGEDVINQEHLAKEIKTTPANISIGMKKGNPSIKTLKKWLRPFKAKVIIIDKNGKAHKL